MATEENGRVSDTPELSPAYQPAKEDSGILIRFIGNTPNIAGINLIAVGAFHLFAAAKFLEYQGNKMLAMEEARRMQNCIQVPSPGANMPPPPK